MNSLKSVLISTILCLFSFHAVATDYDVLSQKNIINGKPVDIKYAANDFYSIYYIYMNVVRALDIDKHLKDEQIKNLISGMIKGLKKNGLAQLNIKGYPGGDLSVTLRTDISKKDYQPILFLITNYDMQGKQVVGGDGLKTAYASYFYLVGDKLVKYQNVKYAREKLEKAGKNTNSLADFYLLDDKKENDKQGKKLLLLGIKNEEDALQKFLMHLTLSEYYLLEGEVKEARDLLDKAYEQADNASDADIRQKLKGIYRYANDLYRYYVNYRG